MKENYSVYVHIAPNGKKYVGITGTKPKYRWDNGNGYKYQILFWRAIQKYGWDNFKHEILFEGLTKQQACEKEIELISNYKLNNPDYGYNVCIGGDCGLLGLKRSDETKAKISNNRKGKAVGHIVTEETRKKIGYANSHSLKGRKLSDETKLKMSVSMKKVRATKKWVTPCSDETKKKISEKNKGHIVTDETRQKLRNANLGKHHTEKTKQKISEIQQNRTEEEKALISKKLSKALKKTGKERSEKRKATMKERYPNGFKQPESANIARSIAHKGIKKSEETKAKMRKPKSPEHIKHMKEAQKLSHEARKLGMSYKEYKQMIGGNR